MQVLFSSLFKRTGQVGGEISKNFINFDLSFPTVAIQLTRMCLKFQRSLSLLPSLITLSSALCSGKCKIRANIFAFSW